VRQENAIDKVWNDKYNSLGQDEGDSLMMFASSSTYRSNLQKILEGNDSVSIETKMRILGRYTRYSHAILNAGHEHLMNARRSGLDISLLPWPPGMLARAKAQPLFTAASAIDEGDVWRPLTAGSFGYFSSINFEPFLCLIFSPYFPLASIVFLLFCAICIFWSEKSNKTLPERSKENGKLKSYAKKICCIIIKKWLEKRDTILLGCLLIISLKVPFRFFFEKLYFLFGYNLLCGVYALLFIMVINNFKGKEVYLSKSRLLIIFITAVFFSYLGVNYNIFQLIF
jgi:hypothetical protein